MADGTESVDEYVLNRSYAATTRLNCQFYLWKDTLRFNLHPSIPNPTANTRIADVATGTGIWLVDLTREVPPTVEMEGLDISISQCPPAQWLPQNVKMREWDMFTEPSEDLVGKFDIVHIRLVFLVIKNDDPKRLISNLHKLLKPGGYLQWDEYDFVSSSVVAANDSLDTTAVEAMRTYMTSPNKEKGSETWKVSLPDTLRGFGFQTCTAHYYKDDLSMAKYSHDMYMLVVEEFAEKVFKGTEDEQKSRKLIGLAMDQASRGAAISYPKVIWVAKK